jgi:hypothetical protein
MESGPVSQYISQLSYQASLIQQNFLNNKDSHRLGQLATSFHDTQAKRNYFRREKEVDHFWIIVLGGIRLKIKTPWMCKEKHPNLVYLD